MTNLVEKIRCERSKRNQNEVNEYIPLSIYQENTFSEHFIYAQLLIDLLLRLKPAENDRNKFLAHCKEQYREIDHELKLIEQFQNDYSSTNALDWYMKDSFLYRILTRILQLENFDHLFFSRFLLQDISNAIAKNKSRTTIRVYRCQLLTKDEIQFLENSLGCLLSSNSFLSTSIHRELALVFLKQSASTNDLEQVLVEIDANPSYTILKPFGFIKCDNSYRQTEEVVFSIGSIFRLMNIYQTDDGMWIMNLSLCTDNDHEIKEIFKPYRSNAKNEPIDLLALGNFLRHIGQINEAEKFFNRLLYEFYGNNPSTADCYYALGSIACEKELYDVSLNCHQKSLEIKSQISKENDSTMADSYNSIAQIYSKKKDHRQALTFYLRALNIIMQIHGDHHLEVARCYTNIGGVYQKQEDYPHALECYEKALVIRQKNYPTSHSDLGVSHNNLANVYASYGQYDLAFEHYNRALKILQSTLSLVHPELGMTYCGLGLIYERRGEFETALSYYQKTAMIYREAFSSNHVNVIQIEQHIQKILSKISES